MKIIQISQVKGVICFIYIASPRNVSFFIELIKRKKKKGKINGRYMNVEPVVQLSV